jgi:hypothetical protein
MTDAGTGRSEGCQPLRDLLARAVEQAEPTLRDRLETEASAHLELIGLVRAARPELDLLEAAAVESARRAGCTWEQVGSALGISRQAAQQRYGRLGVGPSRESVQSIRADQRLLCPVTAFNEMTVLNSAGRYGWHSVGYGSRYHLVEWDNHRWEHARTAFGGKPSGESWQSIGAGWAWWRYWARRLDAPAAECDLAERLLPWG